MSTLLRRDPWLGFPSLAGWLEEPFTALRPFAQPIRIEDFVEGDHYLIRAELAGLDPAKDLEITVGAGYLTIHAERHDKTEGKRRTEFRYGTFTRTLPLPANVNTDDIKADYHDGILSVSVGLKIEEKEAVKKVEVSSSKK